MTVLLRDRYRACYERFARETNPDGFFYEDAPSLQRLDLLRRHYREYVGRPVPIRFSLMNLPELHRQNRLNGMAWYDRLHVGLEGVDRYFHPLVLETQRLNLRAEDKEVASLHLCVHFTLDCYREARGRRRPPEAPKAVMTMTQRLRKTDSFDRLSELPVDAGRALFEEHIEDDLVALCEHARAGVGEHLA